MLNEVSLSGALGRDVAEKLAHRLQLVVPGPDLLLPNLLSVVLDNVGEALRRQGLLPEVIGPEALGVGRVSGAPVMALVEGQEYGLQAGQFGAETCTRFSSTAMWAAQRPGRKRSSLGSRDVRYCSTASSTVCLVRLFLSSKVRMSGSPLMKSTRSRDRCRVPRAVVDLPGHGEAVLQRGGLRLSRCLGWEVP